MPIGHTFQSQTRMSVPLFTASSIPAKPQKMPGAPHPSAAKERMCIPALFLTSPDGRIQKGISNKPCSPAALRCGAPGHAFLQLHQSWQSGKKSWECPRPFAGSNRIHKQLPERNGIRTLMLHRGIAFPVRTGAIQDGMENDILSFSKIELDKEPI